MIDARTAEQPQDVRGLAHRQPQPQRAAVGEGLGEHRHAAQPLGMAVRAQGPDLGVGSGGGLGDGDERCDPRADLSGAAGVGGDHPACVGFGHSGPHERALEQGNRLVVAHDRPVDRQLQRLGLAADRGEDGLPAHACRFGDGANGGRAVPLLGEQPGGGVDDGTAGGAGMRRSQLRAVWLFDRWLIDKLAHLG
jgi:hypothetical protein